MWKHSVALLLIYQHAIVLRDLNLKDLDQSRNPSCCLLLLFIETVWSHLAVYKLLAALRGQHWKLACLIVLSNVMLVIPFCCCIQLLLALIGSDKTFLWIFVLCLCTSCAWHSAVNECEWCFVFRFLPLSIHLWHWEPHQPIQHQWNTSAPCCSHLYPAERTPVCGGRNQH